MSSLGYIAQSLPWIIAGLLVGYFVGRSTVAVQVIADAVQDGDDVTEEKPTRKPRFTTNQVIGSVVVILGVFTAVQSYVQGEATERLQICQQAYSNGFADAIEERSKASAEAQQALEEFLTAVSKATPTPEGRASVGRALQEYLAKRAVAKKAQEENPYPAPPRDVC